MVGLEWACGVCVGVGGFWEEVGWGGGVGSWVVFVGVVGRREGV